MKTWKLIFAIALAVMVVLLMTSSVLAASAGGEQTHRAYGKPESILTGTLPMTHPVGIVIAAYFNIPYTQVMTLHDEGLGFGVIARAYLTAFASGGALTPEQVLDMRQAGVGWGQIKKDYSVHPGDNGSGCPGNSCNAPGQQKPSKVKPAKGPKN
jgi:hypothetical protein